MMRHTAADDQSILKRAMHILERQDQTEWQLFRKLLRNDYPEEAIEAVISYLKQCRYLDDERYARTFIRFRQEKHGRLRLKNDLERRGVPKEVIRRCMEEEFSSDERLKIRELLQKRHFAPETADSRECRKMYQFLLRRGFRHADILSQMSRHI